MVSVLVYISGILLLERRKDSGYRHGIMMEIIVTMDSGKMDNKMELEFESGMIALVNLDSSKIIFLMAILLPFLCHCKLVICS